MDKYAPRLLDLGEKAMIGKGKRSKEVIDAVIRNHAVYFAAIGGAGALLSKCITKSEIVCYEDLGAEAIRQDRGKRFSGHRRDRPRGKQPLRDSNPTVSHIRRNVAGHFPATKKSLSALFSSGLIPEQAAETF